jgi:hypothetical protein
MRHAFGKMNFPIQDNPTERRYTMAKKAQKKVVKKKSQSKSKAKKK